MGNGCCPLGIAVPAPVTGYGNGIAAAAVAIVDGRPS